MSRPAAAAGASPQPDPWASLSPDVLPSSLTLELGRLRRLNRSAVVVDLGCGRGEDCRRLRAAGFGSVVGIDVNHHALRFATFTSPGVRYLRGDARALPLAPGVADVVVCKALLTTMYDPPDRVAVVAEVARVLRRGGRVVVEDFLQTWSSPLYRRRYQAGQAQGLDAGTFLASQSDGQSYLVHHYTLSEMADLLGQARLSRRSLRQSMFTTQNGHLVRGFTLEALRLR